MKNIKNIFLMLAFFFLLVTGCDKEKSNEIDKQKLEQMLKNIKEIAASSVCNDEENYELKYIKYGTRNCYGVGFLAYSSSINMQQFEKLVEQYNQLEREYLDKTSVNIDCEALITKPKLVTCENNKPKLVY